jgi:hypothetical protein
MLKPEASEAALELYEALEPAFTQYDDDNEWAALRFCEALVAADLDLIHELVTTEDEDGVPWQVLFDPLNCPAVCLPYLAQYVGARFTPGMTVEQQRAAIAAPEAFLRGTVGAIEALVKRYLTGTQTVIITERYGGFPWRLRIETISGETPDQAAIEDALRREQKPIGIVLFFNKRSVWTWLEVRTSSTPSSPTWLKARENFTTWKELRIHEP